MLPRTRIPVPPTSGISQLIDRLSVDAAGDRGMWSTLVSVDWTREDLEELKDTAVDAVLRRILRTELPPHETCLPTMGWEFQLLDAMAPDSLGEWFNRSNSPQESVDKFLKVVLLTLTQSRGAFELEDQPENKACSVAGNLVCRLYSECLDLCRSDGAAKATAVIAYKIWTWTGAAFNQTKWASYTWAEVGMVGTIFLCTFMHDMRVRREFRAFCASGGVQRWRCVVSWLEVRILMLKASPQRSMEDVADLVTIMFSLAEMSDVAARSILEGPFPNACISMLSQKREITDVYLSMSASFIHAITNGMGSPTETAYTEHLQELLQAGFLIPLRNVVLYTISGNDHPSYIRTWSCLRAIVSATLHHRSVPFIGKAFADLPPIWEKDGEAKSFERWNRITGTVDLFVKGYTRFIDRALDSVCDNLECQKVDMTAKECGGCKQVLYCSRRCQTQAWFAGHKEDCQRYKVKDLPIPRVTQTSKIFLANVLAVMILTAPKSQTLGREATRSSEDRKVEEVEEGDKFRIFNIGPRITDKTKFSIERLQEYARSIAVPTQFLKMLESARTNKEYILAAFALADPPQERFYIFGLFKKSDDITNQQVLIPIKVIEVTGVDGFVFKEE